MQDIKLGAENGHLRPALEILTCHALTSTSCCSVPTHDQQIWCVSITEAAHEVDHQQHTALVAATPASAASHQAFQQSQECFSSQA